jgi:phosphoribosylanthranilate isomerase
MVWIKICGITNVEDAEFVSTLKVDSIGFVFSTDSPRRINLDKALEITGALRGEGNKVKIAGVFVNEKIEYVIGCSNKLGLDYIQLSGDENSNYVKSLREVSDKPEKRSCKSKIIKAIKIKEMDKKNTDDCNYNSAYNTCNIVKAKISQKIESFKGYADFILLDTFREGVYGGTGETFNRDIIKCLKCDIPVILSGGLDSKNVKEAIDILKPFGVDASSRLEIYPGKKDPEKVRQFVDAVRS